MLCEAGVAATGAPRLQSRGGMDDCGGEPASPSAASAGPAAGDARRASGGLCGDGQHGKRMSEAAFDAPQGALKPVPLAQLLSLDQVGPRGWALTNVRTFERAELEGTSELVVDGESADAVVAGESGEGEPVVFEVHSLLRKELYVDEQGAQWILHGEADGPGSCVSLDYLASRAKTAAIKVNVGGGQASYDFQVFVFNRGRYLNSRVYWDLRAIYKHLGLKAFRGSPGVWVSRSRPSWVRRWQELVGDAGGAEHFVHSVDERGSQENKLKVPYPERRLPSPAAGAFLRRAPR